MLEQVAHNQRFKRAFAAGPWAWEAGLWPCYSNAKFLKRTAKREL
jgi:hypothetical protein